MFVNRCWDCPKAQYMQCVLYAPVVLNIYYYHFTHVSKPSLYISLCLNSYSLYVDFFSGCVYLWKCVCFSTCLNSYSLYVDFFSGCVYLWKCVCFSTCMNSGSFSLDISSAGIYLWRCPSSFKTRTNRAFLSMLSTKGSMGDSIFWCHFVRLSNPDAFSLLEP